ncbi:MAG: hypothetical protein ABSA48_04285 [Terracidiphilus sp.]|jgi:hypothetical protein
MLSNMKMRIPVSTMRRSLSISSLVFVAFFLAAPLALAQAPTTRFLGTITAISGATVTVKTDAGDVRQFDVPSTAAIKRISPGQKDLSAADTLQFSDLETGDRVLVKLDPVAPGPPAQALQIVAVKQADLVKKQQEEREDWQKRGVGGLVKSVDSAAGVLVLTSGTGATAKTIAVHTTKATVLKRYAPASVRFDEAKPAPIDAIHPGDQLRARGTKNEDGTEIAAEEVISGTFRNISGTIVSLDAAASMLVVKDLTTKKQVTIHITADAQMRRLPDRVAQALAARLTGAASGAGGKGGTAPPQNAAPAASPHNGVGADPQQILHHAQVIQLTALKKGDAIMVVSTDGATEVTAITLLAGVEPLLEAPAATQSLLSNWSMSSGAPEVAPE